MTGPSRIHPSPWRRLCAAAVVYAVLTAVLTYPQVLSMGAVRADAGGRPTCDALEAVWTLAWNVHAVTRADRQLENTNVYYPRANTVAYFAPAYGYLPLVAPIIWVTGNPVLAYNVCLMATFVACALAMFVLMSDLTGSPLAAGIAGFAFAFAPIRFGYYCQLTIPSSQWMVLALWCLGRYCRQQRLRYALGVWAFTFLQGLFCVYYFVFFCTLFPLACAVYAGLDRRLRSRRNALLLALFYILLAVCLLPFYAPFMRHSEGLGYGRTFDDNVRYSADILSYASTPSTNRIYGGWLKAWPESETYAFPGFALIALACVGAWSCLRSRSRRSRQTFLVCTILGGASFVLSLGPVIQFGGHRICWGPYWLLQRFVPVYGNLRAPGRFAMLVVMFLCVLAGYGARELLRRRGARARRFLSLGVLLLLAVECVHVPLALAKVPLRGDLPPVYGWLRSQPDSTSAVELPLDLGPHDYDYLYASAYHWRKLVNGVSGYYPPENVAKYLIFRRGLASPECPRLLADLGVDYVIIHGDRMPVKVEKLVIADGLTLHQQFGNDYVYRVTAQPTAATPEPKWREIDRDAWQVRSNAPSSDPAFAIDGDLATHWRTAGPPTGGMRFHIDLGAEQRIGRVELAFGAAGNEFPRHFIVRVSQSGARWRRVIAETDMPRVWADVYRSALAAPRNVSVDLVFAPEPCRHIVIELVRRKAYSGWAWSFAEVRAYQPVNKGADKPLHVE